MRHSSPAQHFRILRVLVRSPNSDRLKDLDRYFQSMAAWEVREFALAVAFGAGALLHLILFQIPIRCPCEMTELAKFWKI